MYALQADLILLLHAAVVLFVILGEAAILIGAARRWHWVRNLAFRIGHLLVILIVVGQAWAGSLCPLTEWENALRLRSGQAPYEASFVEHWIGRWLYVELPLWQLSILYSAFAALVLWSWWRVPPRRGS